MSTIVNTGFKLAQTVISNGAVTGNQWSNPNNLLLTDGDVSESNPGAGVASDVVIGNFLAQVPGNAVITGIELQIIGKAGAQTSPVLTLTPYALDNSSGTDNYYPYVTPFTGLTPDIASHILGSSSYLFATAWTPDMINNFKLQLVANGDLYIDSALLNVYYYIPDDILPPPPPPTGCGDCNSPIETLPFYLAQPFLSGDRYAFFKSFNYPDGTPIQYADLGSCGGYIQFVFDPGVPKVGTQNFQENAKTAIWETMPDGTVRFDFVDINVFRGLLFHTPYTADPALRSNHDQNSKVIISANAPFFGQYLQRCQIGSVVSAPLEVQAENVSVANPVTKMNFMGAGQSTTQDLTDPEKVNIVIPGAGGTTPPNLVSSTSISSENSQVGTLSTTLDISGLNRGVVIQVSTEQLASITSVTVGGVAATREVFIFDVSHNIRSEQWVCVNPPLGTQSVVVNLSQPAYLTFGAECLAGINTGSPVGTTQSAAGVSNSPSLSISTGTDYSIILDGLATAQTPILYTPGAGQALNWSRVANIDTRQGGSSVESSGIAPDAVTMSYSITQNTPWLYTAIEIKGITSSSTPLLLKTNGTPNATQAILNLVQGSDISITDDGLGNVTINSLGGGGSSPFSINQIGHGFIVGDIIRPTTNQWATSQSDNSTDAEAWAQVILVTDVDNFTALPLQGTRQTNASIVALLASFSGGDVMYVDETTPGSITDTPPTSSGTVSKPVGYVEANATGTPIALLTVNYRGQENQAIPSSLTTFSQRLLVQMGTSPNDFMSSTTDPSDGSLYVVYGIQNGSAPKIIKYSLDNTGKYYRSSAAVAVGADAANFPNVGVAVIGGFVYVSFVQSTGPTYKLYRVDKTNFATQVAMTISGTAPNTASGHNCCYTDGTDIYIASTATTWYRYTISGTTATNAATITSLSGIIAAYCPDGVNVYLTDDNSNNWTTGTIYKTSLTGGSLVTITRPYIFSSEAGTFAGIGFAEISSTSMYVLAMYIQTNATVNVGTSIMLEPVTKPV